MKNLFLFLSAAVVFYFSSCTASSSSLNVSPSPVLVTNPTTPPSNLTISGYFRAHVNGVLFNSPFVYTTNAGPNDTTRTFAGKISSGSTFPALSLTILNYDSVKTGTTYVLDMNNPSSYNCQGIIGGIGYIDSAITVSSAANMATTLWHINFSVKTAHHITGVFDFKRQDGMQITNGQIDMGW